MRFLTILVILYLSVSCTKEDIDNSVCGIVTDKLNYYDDTNGKELFFIELNNQGYRVTQSIYNQAQLDQPLCLNQ